MVTIGLRSAFSQQHWRCCNVLTELPTWFSSIVFFEQRILCLARLQRHSVFVPVISVVVSTQGIDVFIILSILFLKIIDKCAFMHDKITIVEFFNCSPEDETPQTLRFSVCCSLNVTQNEIRSAICSKVGCSTVCWSQNMLSKYFLCECKFSNTKLKLCYFKHFDDRK